MFHDQVEIPIHVFYKLYDNNHMSLIIQYIRADWHIVHKKI